MLRGLRARIILIQGGIIAAALILMGIVFYQIQEKDTITQFIGNAEAVNGIFQNRVHGESSKAYSGIASMQALNNSYMFSKVALLSGTDTSAIADMTMHLSPRLADQFHAMLTNCTPGFIDASHMRMIKLFPVRRQGALCTSLAVVSNDKYFSKQLFLLIEIIIAYILLNFFILTIVSWFIIDRYTVVPLQRFERAVEGVSHGDYPQIKDMPAAKELRQIIKAFNAMTKAIQAKEQSLKDTIKELHETQAMVIRKEKLATIGTLVSGISHEIGNPLSAIISLLGSVSPETSPDGKGRGTKIDVITRSLSEAYRIDALIRQLLLYVRQKPAVPIEVHIRPLIDDVLSSIKLTKDLSGIELSVDSDDSLVYKTDYEKLRQVLVNLITNAADAIHKKGAISIRAAEQSGSLVIGISDTGEGIADEQREKIFEPFFTTKSSNKGTGLGLAIVKNIVQELGGEIGVKSKKGEGTTFTVKLSRGE